MSLEEKKNIRKFAGYVGKVREAKIMKSKEDKYVRTSQRRK